MGLQLTGSSAQFWTRPVGLTRDSFGGQNLSGPGITMCAWVKVASSLSGLGSGTSYILGLGGAPDAQGFGGLFTDQFNGIFVIDWSDSSNSGQYANQFNYTLGSWTCVVGFLQANGKQAFYASTATNPATIIQAGGSPQLDLETFSSVVVGFQTTNAGFGAPTATNLISVAEFAIWKGILGSAEALKIFSGVNPSTIQPGILYSYYPLRTDLNDYGSQHIALSPNGGAVANFIDHPLVQPIEPLRRAFEVFPKINIASAGAISPAARIITYQSVTPIHGAGSIATIPDSPMSSSSATIDFGSTPVNEGSFVITNGSITSTTVIEAFIMGSDSTGANSAADHQHAAASWQMTCIPGTGNFTLDVTCMEDLCWGTFIVRYAYS